jgi:hypothetical protein
MAMMDRRHEPRNFGSDATEWRKALLEMVLNVEGALKDEEKIEAALLELRELLDSRIKLARGRLGLHGY